MYDIWRKIQQLSSGLKKLIFNVLIYIHNCITMNGDYCCSGKRCDSWAFSVLKLNVNFMNSI